MQPKKIPRLARSWSPFSPGHVLVNVLNRPLDILSAASVVLTDIPGTLLVVLMLKAPLSKTSELVALLKASLKDSW